MLNIYLSKGMRNIVNFGDTVNTFLVSSLTGKKAQFCFNNKVLRYMVAGSILQIADTNCIIWGSGLMFSNRVPSQLPKEICAIRGPKSHQLLKSHNILAPEIYGDPILLFPRIYKPNVQKKYEVGVIPHYVDKKHPWIELVKQNKNIKIIDIQNKNFKEFVDDVLSCNKILSSSLHGIIIGDAYKIPSYWIKISDKLCGGNFKFSDYFASVKRKMIEIPIDLNTHMKDIITKMEPYEVELNLDPLIKSCPFGPIIK